MMTNMNLNESEETMGQVVRLAGSANNLIPPMGYSSDIDQGVTLKFKDGAHLYKRGEVPAGLFLLTNGVVKVVSHRKVTRGRRASPEFVTKLAGPGDLIGYREVVDGTEYETTAQSVRESEVKFFPKDSIIRILSGPTTLLKLALKQAARDLKRSDNITELHYLASVQERISFQILNLAEQFGRETPEGTLISLKLTRNEFAQLAGTINESFSRHLTELKAEGVIDLLGKDILVKNLATLKEKAGQA